MAAAPARAQQQSHVAVLLSLQSAPVVHAVVQPAIAVCVQAPVVLSHASVVQALPSSHEIAVPAHFPEAQTSPVVQALPSVQAVPFLTFAYEQ